MLRSLVKRFVPFFAAFTLGLLVAGLFVTIGFPVKFSANFERRGSYCERMRAEREAVRAAEEAIKSRRESCRAKFLAEREARRAEEMYLEDAIPAPPAPPAPPQNVR